VWADDATGFAAKFGNFDGVHNGKAASCELRVIS
jgi:FAD synthase